MRRTADNVDRAFLAAASRLPPRAVAGRATGRVEARGNRASPVDASAVVADREGGAQRSPPPSLSSLGTFRDPLSRDFSRSRGITRSIDVHRNRALDNGDSGFT